MVKIIVPSGLRQLWPTAPVCALTLSRRRYDGYECTVIELASDVCTATGRPLALRGALGSHAVPCVLSSSFEWGDHWSEVTAVFRLMTWSGCGMGVVDLTVKTRILPSGYVEPVARRSGCHGHHDSAWTGADEPGTHARVV